MLIPRLLPKLVNNVLKLLLFDSFFELFICVFIEPLLHLFSLGVFVLKGDFFEAVDYPFEIPLRKGGHINISLLF